MATLNLNRASTLSVSSLNDYSAMLFGISTARIDARKERAAIKKKLDADGLTAGQYCALSDRYNFLTAEMRYLGELEKKARKNLSFEFNATSYIEACNDGDNDKKVDVIMSAIFPIFPGASVSELRGFARKISSKVGNVTGKASDSAVVNNGKAVKDANSMFISNAFINTLRELMSKSRALGILIPCKDDGYLCKYTFERNKDSISTYTFRFRITFGREEVYNYFWPVAIEVPEFTDTEPAESESTENTESENTESAIKRFSKNYENAMREHAVAEAANIDASGADWECDDDDEADNAEVVEA